MDFSSANYFTEVEILDIVRALKESDYGCLQAEKPSKLFSKAFKTLAQLMSYMNQQINFPLITKKYNKVNMENIIKLIYRCNHLLEARCLAFKVLSDILRFERLASEIRNQVDELLDTLGSTAELQTQIKEATARSFSQLAESIIDNIALLRDDYKIFSAMRATTSKGHQVGNVMVYKRRDAMRYILREYDSIKRLVLVADINEMKILTAK